MGSAIEWTDETWNPTVGCSKTSPGCDNCYAINVAHRAMQPAHEGLTIVRDGERPDWTGEVRTLPDRLDTPLRWRKPRRVFVDSMSDLFHPDVPMEFIQRVFTTMTLAHQHTFQVLTKRSKDMANVLNHEDFWYGIAEEPPDNIWVGTSIESDHYSWRAHHLRRAEVAVRFLSLEPLLGPLPSLDLTDIDWVIVGGESGPGARPMHPQWVRDIRDRCVAAGIPFFFKQWGSWAQVRYPDYGRKGDRLIFAGATSWDRERERAIYVREVGKKRAGRELDGRTWDEMPVTEREREVMLASSQEVPSGSSTHPPEATP